LNSQQVVNHPICPPKQAWDFSRGGASPMNRPDLMTPPVTTTITISLNFYQYFSCRTNLPQFLIPLVCEGTGLAIVALQVRVIFASLTRRFSRNAAWASKSSGVPHKISAYDLTNLTLSRERIHFADSEGFLQLNPV
jgi:hypothetical protein